MKVNPVSYVLLVAVLLQVRTITSTYIHACRHVRSGNGRPCKRLKCLLHAGTQLVTVQITLATRSFSRCVYTPASIVTLNCDETQQGYLLLTSVSPSVVSKVCTCSQHQDQLQSSVIMMLPVTIKACERPRRTKCSYTTALTYCENTVKQKKNHSAKTLHGLALLNIAKSLCRSSV